MDFFKISIAILDLLILCLIPALIRHAKAHTALVIYIKQICEALKIKCELRD